MLNEFRALSRSIEAAQIQTESWHPQYMPCSKEPAFVFELASDGIVLRVAQQVDRQRLAEMRKFQGGSNGETFPVFRLPPLKRLRSEHDGELKRIVAAFRGQAKASSMDYADVLAIVRDLVALAEPFWTDATVRKAKKCLVAIPQDLLCKLGLVPPDCIRYLQLVRASANLADRMDGVPVQVRLTGRVSMCASAYAHFCLDRALIHKYSDPIGRLGAILTIACARTAMVAPDDAADMLENILVVPSTASAETLKGKPWMLTIKASTARKDPYHADVQHWINSRLMSASQTVASCPSTNPQAMQQAADPYGLSLSPNDLTMNAKMPKTNLPALGSISLRSLSDEEKCNSRYGRIGPLSFPVSARLRQNLKNAAEWMAHPDRKGKTWQRLGPVAGYKTGLLYAYPEGKIDCDASVSAMIGGFDVEDGSVSGSGSFVEVARHVVGALTGLIREIPDTLITTMVLVKADSANAKMLLHTRFTAERLISAAREWEEGCRNLPKMLIPAGKKLGSRYQPYVPFPLETGRMLNLQWTQTGDRCTETYDLTICDCFDLFVAEGNVSRLAAQKALRAILKNATGLLLTLGGANHMNITHSPKDVKQSDYLIMRAMPSLAALALSKLGITKEDYMKDAPFLLGRLLAATDILHREYCVHVRKGAMPGQLLGNAVMAEAASNPTKALSRLLDRVKIYQAWQNQMYSSKDPKYKTAHWAARMMQEVASQLAEAALPNKMNDADRAQLLLGYLARIKDDKEDNGLNRGTEEVQKEESTNE